MAAHKTRDLVILIAAGVIALALFLTERSKDERGGDQGEVVSHAPKADIAAPEPKRAIEELSPGADSPAEGIPHRYFPLVPGSTWIYRVDGPQRFVPKQTWMMTLITAPQGEQPGQVQVGFEGALKEARIWLDRGIVRFDGLPFFEPVEYLGNVPLKAMGEFLPQAERIGKDAVWVQEFERQVTHEYRDERGRLHTVAAEARQRDRASVTDIDEVAVPAGRFFATRVSWLSRIEIKAAGRPVLQDMTSEPFKKETMWIVAGIGVVRRRIDYSGYRGVVLSFDLVQYRRRAASELPAK